MLSAVAARKLKQGQQDPAVPSPATVQPAAPIPSSSNGPPLKGNTSPSKKASNKPSSKRKPSGQPAPKSATKKPRRSRSKGKDKATPRYFAEPVHADASDDDAVISAHEDEEDEREGMLVGLDTDPLPSSTKRAYSPSRPVEEDSSDDDVPAPSAHLRLKSVQRQPAPVTLSTFEPSLDHNMFVLTADERSMLALGDENAIVLLLSAQETFSFIGTSRLHVLRGCMVIHGTTLRASNISHPIFAPRSSPVPTLQAITTPDGSSEQFSVVLPSRIKRLSKDTAAIIALREMFTGVEGLGHVVRTFDGVFRPGSDDSVLELPLAGAAMCVRSSRDVQPFVMPSSWEDALQEVASVEGSEAPPVYFVKGPKNSGKSTLARTMVNRLTARYRRVAYLDCDVGQSEFTPGGMVALTVVERPVFGPPFTHMTVPYQAHYLGSSSPRSSPSHYLSCIEALLHAYRIDLQHSAVVDVDDEAEDERISESIPLVINTMGWAKGLGADLTLKIEHLAAPTTVFSLYVDPPPEEYDGPPLHRLDPIAPPAHVPRYTAADHRALALLSYFHAIFPSSERTVAQRTAEKWDTRLPLCAIPPYELDMRGTIKNVVLAGAGMEDVVPAEILRVLNGALVGLVRSDDDGVPYSSEGEWVLPYSQAASPPDPTASHCTALAVMRAVSPDGSKVQLLTPLPSSANTFVKGELEIPVWGMLDFRDGGAGEEMGLPFLRWGKAGADGAIGGERRRIRRNLMRKGQM